MKKNPEVLKFEIVWLRGAVELLRSFDKVADRKRKRVLLRYAWDRVSAIHKKGGHPRLAVRLLIDAIYSRLPSQSKGKAW